MSLNKNISKELYDFIKTNYPEIKVVDVLVSLTMVMTSLAIEAGAPLSKVVEVVVASYCKMLEEEDGD